MNNPEEMAIFFKSFSHPTRVRIVQHLRRSKMLNFDELAAKMQPAPVTVYEHLKFLLRSGVVKKTEKTKHGTFLFLDEALIEQYLGKMQP